MFRIVVKESVYPMLNDAYSWYEERRPGLGELLLDEFDRCLKKLQQNPFYYSIDKEDFRDILLKRFPYKIIFIILDEEVIVYAVYHTGRNSPEFFG